VPQWGTTDSDSESENTPVTFEERSALSLCARHRDAHSGWQLELTPAPDSDTVEDADSSWHLRIHTTCVRARARACVRVYWALLVCTLVA
jgi:hypothetical protein